MNMMTYTAPCAEVLVFRLEGDFLNGTNLRPDSQKPTENYYGPESDDDNWM